MGKLKAIFIHHSTGANIIKQGKLREKVKQFLEIELYDQGYNRVGLYKLKSLYNPHVYGFMDANGKKQTETIFIPNNNTNPDGLFKLFNQETKAPTSNALSKILEYDIVIFKSCFPVTAIETDMKLYSYKNYYLKIRDTISNNPSKIFIPLTPPPLRAFKTKAKWAKRARKFAKWLTSDEYKNGLKNLYVFDLFNLLASSDNTLKKEYQRLLPFDSHPNKKANIQVADEFTKFITNIDSINNHKFDN